MSAKSKSKDQNKKRNRVLVVIFFSLAIIGSLFWGVWLYTKPDNFPIEKVKIFAAYEHVNKESLQVVVRSYLSGGIFYLNVFGLKKSLLKFPWVYAVSIKRKWPDAIIINVVEESPVLRWGKKSLVNSFGTIFTPAVSTFPKGLPVVLGPKGQEKEVISIYSETEKILKPLDLVVKKLILLDSRHYWEIVLSNEVIIYLKEDDPIDQLKLFADVYRKITASRKGSPKIFDLRYQSGFAVKW